MTLTGQPWELTPDAVREARGHGLDEQQVEAAIGVIAMFNYFTRVADATGIEFDYQTPLPAFEPDLRQAAAPRPDPPGSAGGPAGDRRSPGYERLRTDWAAWRGYVLGADEPITRRERRLLAAVAAGEAADWQAAGELDGHMSGQDRDGRLAGFARKLSRQPWRMTEEDLNGLRELGYPDEAILHVISVVAHQNADSRLARGLTAAARH